MGKVEQWETPPPRLGLDRRQEELATDALQLLADLDGPGVKVNIIPAQAERLASAQAIEDEPERTPHRADQSWRRTGICAQLADQAGISLIELAFAFVLRHPAITSAIIGPRTMEHLESQLPAAEVHLTDDVLDAIDSIVAPGVTINPADDAGSAPPRAAARRR